MYLDYMYCFNHNNLILKITNIFRVEKVKVPKSVAERKVNEY